jgi:hypothetical protein
MPTHPDRRQFLRLSAGAVVAVPVAHAHTTHAATMMQGPTDADGLTHYQIGPHIWVRWRHEPLLSYRAHPTQKMPYVFPLTGPASGLSLTAESALPWPHHRSLFFGCDQVNGGNYWQDELERGQVVSRGPSISTVSARSIDIVDACDWRQPGQTVQMTDTRRLTVSVPGDRHRVIDIDITWRAEVDVTIAKTNHALCAIRAAADVTPLGGGRLVSSEGLEGEAGTFGKPARWCAFVGRRTRAKGEPMEGIALMDHPGNPWAPCPGSRATTGSCRRRPSTGSTRHGGCLPARPCACATASSCLPATYERRRSIACTGSGPPDGPSQTRKNV